MSSYCSCIFSSLDRLATPSYWLRSLPVLVPFCKFAESSMIQTSTVTRSVRILSRFGLKQLRLVMCIVVARSCKPWSQFGSEELQDFVNFVCAFNFYITFLHWGLVCSFCGAHFSSTAGTPRVQFFYFSIFSFLKSCFECSPPRLDWSNPGKLRLRRAGDPAWSCPCSCQF